MSSKKAKLGSSKILSSAVLTDSEHKSYAQMLRRMHDLTTIADAYILSASNPTSRSRRIKKLNQAVTKFHTSLLGSGGKFQAEAVSADGDCGGHCNPPFTCVDGTCILDGGQLQASLANLKD